MILIKNGDIYDGKGNILKNTDVLIDKKTIKEIGKNIQVNDDVEIYDAKDKLLFPGFIDSLNVWGATGPGWGDNDLNEHSDPITPEMNVMYSFDQDSMMFQRVFEYGVTSVGITPSTSNVLGGYAAVYKTFGDHPYEMLVKEKVAMVGSVSKKTKEIYASKDKTPMTKMGAMALLKESIIKSIEYKDKNKKDYDSKLEAMQMVINKEAPIFINCNTRSEMEAIEFLLKDLPVDLVFTGAFASNEHTGNIINKPFKIILGDLSQAMSVYNENIDIEGIKKLIEKGVDVAISSSGDDIASGKESLLWNAILYYKYGFDHKDVLKMITSIPAKILGVEDKIGSIEVGKEADIVVWSDNPIKTYEAKVEATFIDGNNILNTRRDKTCWS